MKQLDPISYATNLLEIPRLGSQARRFRARTLLAFGVIGCLVVACAADRGRTSAAPGAAPATAAAAPDQSGPDTSVSSDDDISQATVDNSPVGCEKEIALECGNDKVDGCLVKHPKDPTKLLTSYHVCVARAEAKGGPDCAQEIARECPQGQRDACLVTPRLSDVHICVTVQ